MPRYQFSISTNEVCEAGVIHSDSFAEALDAISESAREGSTLEIGVEGFPPARFELGELGWHSAANRLAA